MHCITPDPCSFEHPVRLKYVEHFANLQILKKWAENYISLVVKISDINAIRYRSSRVKTSQISKKIKVEHRYRIEGRKTTTRYAKNLFRFANIQILRLQVKQNRLLGDRENVRSTSQRASMSTACRSKTTTWGRTRTAATASGCTRSSSPRRQAPPSFQSRTTQPIQSATAPMPTRPPRPHSHRRPRSSNSLGKQTSFRSSLRPSPS